MQRLGAEHFCSMKINIDLLMSADHASVKAIDIAADSEIDKIDY